MPGDAQPSLIEYPTDFPLKIVGTTQPGYALAHLRAVEETLNAAQHDRDAAIGKSGLELG
jgi:putative lipoic acid-binding regulatory protein